MNFQFYLEKLYASDSFKKFKEEYELAYPCSCFFIVDKSGSDNKQHFGWGRKLMQEAENIALESGYLNISVISGIGTREYYKKWGYKLDGTYMRTTL